MRLLVLPLAAIVITALCVWKLTRVPTATDVRPAEMILRPAPLFIAHDAQKPPQLVRMSSYVGRHRILLVFFDGQQGFHRDPLIQRLRDVADELLAQDVHIFAISPALPQTNRAILKKLLADGETWPFPILSDPTLQAHAAWSRLDPETKQLLGPAVFLIDRAGRVAYEEERPQPLADPPAVVDHLLSGA